MDGMQNCVDLSRSNAAPLIAFIAAKETDDGTEFSDANEAEVCRVETNSVGRPASATDAAREFILEFLSEKPVRWEKVESAVTARSLASVGTLNALRAEMAKSGEIEQVGKGKSTRWKLGQPSAEE